MRTRHYILAAAAVAIVAIAATSGLLLGQHNGRAREERIAHRQLAAARRRVASTQSSLRDALSAQSTDDSEIATLKDASNQLISCIDGHYGPAMQAFLSATQSYYSSNPGFFSSPPKAPDFNPIAYQCAAGG